MQKKSYMNNMNDNNSNTVSASFQQQIDELETKISGLNEKFVLQKQNYKANKKK